MTNSNYLKDDFHHYLQQDTLLFERIIVSNKKYFFVWDFENQEHLWLSKSIYKKLGFKSSTTKMI